MTIFQRILRAIIVRLGSWLEDETAPPDHVRRPRAQHGRDTMGSWVECVSCEERVPDAQADDEGWSGHLCDACPLVHRICPDCEDEIEGHVGEGVTR